MQPVKLTMQQLLDGIAKAKSSEESDTSQLLNSLPEAIRDKYKSKPVEVKLSVDLDFTPKWCLCELPEGSYPRVFLYNDLIVLLEAIAKREGSDTAVWITYGSAFRLTKAVNKPNGGKVRYLLLPDDKAIKIDSEQPPIVIDSSLLPADLELQDDGWLGELNTSPDYFIEGVSHIDESEEDKP